MTILADQVAVDPHEPERRAAPRAVEVEQTTCLWESYCPHQLGAQRCSARQRAGRGADDGGSGRLPGQCHVCVSLQCEAGAAAAKEGARRRAAG